MILEWRVQAFALAEHRGDLPPNEKLGQQSVRTLNS